MAQLLFSLSALSLVLVGIFGILTRRNLVRVLLALNILETGINLLLVAMGVFPGARVPIIQGRVTSVAGFADPLPHALVLTSIVIGLGVTGLALTLILRFHRRHGTLNLDQAHVVDDEEKESQIPATPKETDITEMRIHAMAERRHSR